AHNHDSEHVYESATNAADQQPGHAVGENAPELIGEQEAAPWPPAGILGRGHAQCHGDAAAHEHAMAAGEETQQQGSGHGQRSVHGSSASGAAGRSSLSGVSDGVSRSSNWA